MTLSDERYRAILLTQRFLRNLLDPKKTPKVPKAIRQQAYICLRHYPGEFDMFQIAETASKYLDHSGYSDDQKAKIYKVWAKDRT